MEPRKAVEAVSFTLRRGEPGYLRLASVDEHGCHLVCELLPPKGTR